MRIPDVTLDYRIVPGGRDGPDALVASVVVAGRHSHIAGVVNAATANEHPDVRADFERLMERCRSIFAEAVYAKARELLAAKCREN